MSHYGTPPPDDPDQHDAATGGEPGPSTGGAHAGEPAPYNPYPDNWDAPATGSPAFRAEAPPGPDPYAPGPYPQPGNPYAQQSAHPPPANPYAGNPHPNRPTFGFGGYAGWWTRVGASVIDQLLGSLASLPAILGYVLLLLNATTTTNPDGTQQVHFHQVGLSYALFGVGTLTGLAFGIWNIYIRQGRTGASLGKSVLAVRLVNSDLQPIGAGWCFLRQILHIVDAIPCYLGYFWPIWDAKKQTFADKILSTYVIHATEQQPQPF